MSVYLFKNRVMKLVQLSFYIFLNARKALFYVLSSIFTVGRYFTFLCIFPHVLAVRSGK